MVSICFYFQVHQPYRIRKYSIFDIGKEKDYFNDKSIEKLNNEQIMNNVAMKSYLPANKILLKLLSEHPEFKISFSLSGVFMEQMEEFTPEVLKSFQELVDTGRCEILSETYHHSLAFLHDREEFREQIKLHKEIVKRLFDVEPEVFRNTELIYNNELAKEIEEMGYKGIIAEGADHILGWKSPNFLYKPTNTEKIKVLLKNYKLSDDVAFRFSDREWDEWPLTAPKYVEWANSINGNGEVLNLFMNYETFGEHQSKEAGIFDFLNHLPGEFLRHPDNNFKMPSEVVDSYETRGEYDCHNFISWTDEERDLGAWSENEIQTAAITRIYALGIKVKLTGNVSLLNQWRKLQTSDHFHNMRTKYISEDNNIKHSNPYGGPYDAFITYMNVLQDLEAEVNDVLTERGFMVDGKLIVNKI